MQSIDIADSAVRSIPWPPQPIREVWLESAAWFVVMDLCMAVELALNPNHKFNVLIALGGVETEDRNVRFELHTRYLVTTSMGGRCESRGLSPRLRASTVRGER